MHCRVLPKGTPTFKQYVQHTQQYSSNFRNRILFFLRCSFFAVFSTRVSVLPAPDRPATAVSGLFCCFGWAGVFGCATFSSGCFQRKPSAQGDASLLASDLRIIHHNNMRTSSLDSSHPFAVPSVPSVTHRCSILPCQLQYAEHVYTYLLVGITQPKCSSWVVQLGFVFPFCPSHPVSQSDVLDVTEKNKTFFFSAISSLYPSPPTQQQKMTVVTAINFRRVPTESIKYSAGSIFVSSLVLFFCSAIKYSTQCCTGESKRS